MHTNQLVYLVYGNKADIITEARFSMVSAIHRTVTNNFSIVVITDTPAAFADLPVDAVAITAATISEWSGDIGYHHRSKPLALLSVLDRCEKSILIDSDTVLLSCPSRLFELIDKQTVLVDRVLQNYGGEHDAYQQRCGEYLLQHYKTTPQCHYVNSGLIGLTQGNRQVLETAISLIDEIYVMSGKLFHVEQAALAFALHYQQLQPAAHKRMVQHYYAKKHIFRAQAQTFLDNHSDLLSEQTQKDLLETPLRLPRQSWLYSLRIKLLSLTIPGSKPLKRYYLETMRAGYTYPEPDQHLINEMFLGAARNLKQRDPAQFQALKEQGLDSIFTEFYMPKTIQSAAEQALQAQ